jgi:two-component system, NarL family, invasion response regulator UvrY
MKSDDNLKVALVDDHKLFRKGMVELINDFPGYTVEWEADNGKDFTQAISSHNLPDIVLLDISMPVMDGFETAQWMHQHFPKVKILTLTSYKEHYKIMRMINAGVVGIILKNEDPSELLQALKSIEKDGGYFPHWVTKMILNWPGDIKLSDKEIRFLQLACTELPYKAFGPILQTAPRNVEAMRDSLFRKLEVVTRSGLILYAIKNGIYTIE